MWTPCPSLGINSYLSTAAGKDSDLWRVFWISQKQSIHSTLTNWEVWPKGQTRTLRWFVLMSREKERFAGTVRSVLIPLKKKRKRKLVHFDALQLFLLYIDTEIFTLLETQTVSLNGCADLFTKSTDLVGWSAFLEFRILLCICSVTWNLPYFLSVFYFKACLRPHRRCDPGTKRPLFQTVCWGHSHGS